MLIHKECCETYQKSNFGKSCVKMFFGKDECHLYEW